MQDFAMGFCKDFCCNFSRQFKLIKGNKVPTLKRRPVMMNPSPGRSKSLPNAKGETFNLDVWTPKLDISIIINLFGLLWSIILTHTTSKSHSKSYEMVRLCVKFIVGGFSNTYLRLFGLCEKNPQNLELLHTHTAYGPDRVTLSTLMRQASKNISTY